MNLISWIIIGILCLVVLFLIRIICEKNYELKVLKNEYSKVYSELSLLREQSTDKKKYGFDIFDQIWEDNSI